MVPIFWVYKGLVVFVRKECTFIKKSKSIILDLGFKVRCYLYESRRLRCFFKSDRKSLIPDLGICKGVM